MSLVVVAVGGNHDRPLRLDGDDLELVSASVDGQTADFRMDGQALVIASVRFVRP